MVIIMMLYRHGGLQYFGMYNDWYSDIRSTKIWDSSWLGARLPPAKLKFCRFGWILYSSGESLRLKTRSTPSVPCTWRLQMWAMQCTLVLRLTRWYNAVMICVCWNPVTKTFTVRLLNMHSFTTMLQVFTVCVCAIFDFSWLYLVAESVGG